jgi:hypothetical protein
MRAIYLIILLLVCNVIRAQDFAPVGAKWHFSYGHNYISYESVKDTVIGGKLCKVIETHASTQENPTEIVRVSVHSNAGKIEVFKFNNFYTLYDFNASIGDSWLLPSVLFDEINWQYACDSFAIATVTNISTRTINGRELKVLSVDLAGTSHDWFGENSSTVVEFIEVIGSLNTLFPRPRCIIGGDMASPLRCYFDPLFGQYETNIVDSCTAIIVDTGINLLLSEINQIKIAPNPTTNKTFEILGIESTPINIQIVDLNGRLLYKKEINENEKISLPDLTEGVYFLKVTDKNYNSKTVKLILN